ncbi:YcgL domain-containing protein, partial [Pseudomonas savastanoi]|uniref:YcgL domain-containing protein n=1 Tax=Pseudomonas savastanoi TaxID=29438 RepID=UPI0011C3D697
MKRICSIYRSPKRNEMYLYVLKSDVLKRVPPELLVAFGKPVHAFDLVLSPERALSRKDINVV